MKVTFNQRCSLDVCISINGAGDPELEQEIFAQGETLKFVEIIDETPSDVTLQFGDGTIACGVPKTLIFIEKDD